MRAIGTRVIAGVFWLCACGTTAAPTAPADAGSDVVSAKDTVDATASVDTGVDLVTTEDSADAASTADAAIACADRAGGYVVSGTCNNGGTSIPYACMRATGCTLSWETDFRTWSGPLTGNDFALSNLAGTETVQGHFDDIDNGSYQYVGGKLTCDATVQRLEPTFGDHLCCDPVGQDCAKGKACVPVQEATDGEPVLTTACLELAAAPTSEGAVCTPQSGIESCAPGLLCTGVQGGAKGSPSHCKRLCVKAGDCAAGSQCVVVTGAPRSGVCEAACSPFSDAKDAVLCPIGQNCTAITASNVAAERVMGSLCVVTGSVSAGGTCKSGTDCAAGTVCISSTCKALCDGAHGCASGTPCSAFGFGNGPGMPVGFGFCK